MDLHRRGCRGFEISGLGHEKILHQLRLRRTAYPPLVVAHSGPHPALAVSTLPGVGRLARTQVVRFLMLLPSLRDLGPLSRQGLRHMGTVRLSLDTPLPPASRTHCRVSSLGNAPTTAGLLFGCLLTFELLLMDHRLLIGSSARLVTSCVGRLCIGGVSHRDDEKRSKNKNRLHWCISHVGLDRSNHREEP